MIQVSGSWISSAISKVDGAFLSKILFDVPRRFASSSPSVTYCIPPTKSVITGFLIKFSKAFPCAVPTNWTPRSAIVRAAAASSSVPISSIIIISGIWFSTASIITWCWFWGLATCILRDLPIDGCGKSPSPAISLEVSIIITRLPISSDKTRAISLIDVVLPTPGRPKINIDFCFSKRSRITLTVPKTALPIRQVKPIMLPCRFRIELIRWSVLSIPARLSPLNLPNFFIIWSKSCQTIIRYDKYSVSLAKRTSGRRPRSKTISINDSCLGCFSRGLRIKSGNICNIWFKSSANNINKNLVLFL